MLLVASLSLRPAPVRSTFMPMDSRLAAAVEHLDRILERPGHAHVRLPTTGRSRQAPKVAVRVWTADGLRPRWDNMAVLLVESQGKSSDVDPVGQYAPVVVRIGRKVDGVEVKLPQSTAWQAMTWDTLRDTLLRTRKKLFTPRALAEFVSGQLTLGDFADGYGPGSLAHLSRARAHLSTALTQGIRDAVDLIPPSTERQQDVVRVAAAYLAARILQDKGYFQPSGGLDAAADPLVFLRDIQAFSNGFFRSVWSSSLQRMPVEALQAMATHLGPRVSFALVDHLDVGLLWETALEVGLSLDGEPGSDLSATETDNERHYTPYAVANRLVRALPLERLRPSERVILDPTSGSGTLLLSASMRLAELADTPRPYADYLQSQVIGNDIDEMAPLVTRLRYSLVAESYGGGFSLESPRMFLRRDVRDLKASDLPRRPSVLLANPPYAELGREQFAAMFVTKMLELLPKGGLFGLILPQNFLLGTTHGVSTARDRLFREARLFEVWQLPEGSVGSSAQQPVCVLAGEIGGARGPAIGRRVLSRAEAREVRERGYLGEAWLIEDVSNKDTTIGPQYEPTARTQPLSQCFDVISGVTLRKEVTPTDVRQEGVEYKLFWKPRWRKGRLVRAIDVPEGANWLRYDEVALRDRRQDYSTVLDGPKLFINRLGNRASQDPIGAHLDLEGRCTDNNGFMVFVRPGAKPWNLDGQQALWCLLGVMATDSCGELLTRRRSAMHSQKRGVLELPLPAALPTGFAALVQRAVAADFSQRSAVKLWSEVEAVVCAAYGLPIRARAARTGQSPALLNWLHERGGAHLGTTVQVLGVTPDGQLTLHLGALQNDKQEGACGVPVEVPGWALDGEVFEALLRDDVHDACELRRRPAALKDATMTCSVWQGHFPLDGEF